MSGDEVSRIFSSIWSEQKTVWFPLLEGDYHGYKVGFKNRNLDEYKVYSWFELFDPV